MLDEACLESRKSIILRINKYLEIRNSRGHFVARDRGGCPACDCACAVCVAESAPSSVRRVHVVVLVQQNVRNKNRIMSYKDPAHG